MLKLSDDWRVSVDACNWILEQRRKKSKTDEYWWKPRGFYPHLDDAIREYCNQHIREANNFDEVLTTIQDLNKNIKHACEGIKREDIGPAVNDGEDAADDDFLD